VKKAGMKILKSLNKFINRQSKQKLRIHGELVPQSLEKLPRMDHINKYETKLKLQSMELKKQTYH
jgi:hypothetical protein